MNFETDIIENSEITYLVDFDTNSIKGIGGGIDAFKQYVLLAMQTERYQYPIFSNNYGFQSKDLVSKNIDYIEALTQKRVEECLNDNRVLRIKDFKFDNAKNPDKELSVDFTIDNVYGSIDYEVEV